MNPIGLLIVAAGAFAIAGAIFNWNWFMNHRRARFLVRVLSRTGTRIFYGILGLALTILGILGTLGIVDMSQ